MSTTYKNQVRLIAGRFGGRNIAVPESARPTPSRVRETLFNWLQFDIAGARCLDLFAGSGILGFEALSRGASFVTFVERERASVKHLQDTAQQLKLDPACYRIEAASLPAPLALDGKFDLVFLDPPFAMQSQDALLTWLAASNWLQKTSFIYLETAAGKSLSLPAGWQSHKEKVTGNVSYRLLRLQD